MRFLTFFTPNQSASANRGCPEAMGAMIDAAIESGELIATGGLTHITQGVRVAQANGNVTVTDGPFIEATEVIGGFALFELPSKEVAIERSREFLKIAGDGHVTVRPLMDAPPQ